MFVCVSFFIKKKANNKIIKLVIVDQRFLA